MPGQGRARRPPELTLATAREIGGALLAVGALVACDAIGRAGARMLSLPVPGTVIGILILFAGLVAMRNVPAAMQRTADFALGHLNLLYIPAAVGVVAYASLLGRDAIAIALALVGSAFVGLVAAGWTFQIVARRGRRDDEP